MRKVKSLSAADPRVAPGRANFAGYEDHVGSMSSSDRALYRGKVLAVLSSSGEIIAAAEDIEALREAVGMSTYSTCEWRLVDGPTLALPVELSELDDGGD